MSDKLPTGWTATTIRDLVQSLEYGYTAKAEHRTDGPRLLRITDIENGRVEWASVPRCTIEADRLPKFLLKHGDVVFARTGSIDKACVVRNPPEAVFASYLIRGRPVDVCIAPWLEVFVGSSDYRNQANVASAGIGRANINANNIGRIDLRLAPLPEQHRIVEAIESYFTRLDDTVTSLERVQRNLKRYRASVLKAAVEGRLVPTEAELARAEGRDYEPASVLLERILTERRRRWKEAELAKMKAKGKMPKDDGWKAKYIEPVVPDTSELPQLPEGWCWASVDQLTSHVTSGSRDWTQFYDRGDSVFLMAQNVRPGRLDLSHKQLVEPPPGDPSCERSQVRMNDLLVTIVGANTGNVCRVPTELPRHYVCQSVALMRPIDASEYVHAYLNSPPGQRTYATFMYGQGRPHLSFDNLRETPVPLPPVLEQVRINEAVERQLSVADDVVKSIAIEEVRLTNLRQSILKWAFEGRLVDQDPSDEPASVLLERIRAERQSAGDTTPKARKRRSKRAPKA